MLPAKGESKDAFVARFMGDEKMQKEYPDEKQRMAVANSYWEKREKKTYDLNDVEIFKAGIWNGDEYTDKDLEDMERNFSELSSLVKPYLKLGHDNNQALLQKDGYPSAGWITNIKKKGQSLFADIKSIPEKIYELIDKKAYGRFSPEIFIGLKHGDKKYSKVLKALSLLGAQTPAIMELGDFINLYENYEYDIVKEYTEWSEKMEDVKNYELELENARKEKESLEAKNQELNSKLAEIEKAQRFEKIDAMVKEFVHQGKVLPAQAPLIAALLIEPLEVKSYEYVENNEKKVVSGDSVELVKKVLDLNPKLVELGEQKSFATEKKEEKKFSAMSTESERGEYIDTKVKELIAKEKLSYSDAYKKIAYEIGG